MTLGKVLFLVLVVSATMTNGEFLEKFKVGIRSIIDRINNFGSDIEKQEFWEDVECPKLKKIDFSSKKPKIFSMKLVDSHSIVGEIGVGSKEQKVRVLFDSGAVHSWFLNPTQKRPSLSHYKSWESKTAKASPGEKTLNFGVGSVIGTVFEDKLKIGKESIDSFSFVYIDDLNFSQTRYAGSIGLRPCGEKKTLLEQFKKKGLINHQAFSLYLTPKKSEIILGGFNPDYILKGKKFKYFPLKINHGWSIEAKDFAVGRRGAVGERLSRKPLEGPFVLTFDTGSHPIIFSEKAYDFISKLVPAGKDNVFTKESFEVLPTLVFTLSDEVELKIYPQSYMTCYDDKCRYSIAVNRKLKSNEIILGIAALRQYYTHFDLENMQLGFVKGKDIDYYDYAHPGNYH